MLKIYLLLIFLLLIAIIAGYLCAYLAATVYGKYFVFLPLLIFVLSYSSLWIGFLRGFLIFAAFTFNTLLQHSGNVSVFEGRISWKMNHE